MACHSRTRCVYCGWAEPVRGRRAGEAQATVEGASEIGPHIEVEFGTGAADARNVAGWWSTVGLVKCFNAYSTSDTGDLDGKCSDVDGSVGADVVRPDRGAIE